MNKRRKNTLPLLAEDEKLRFHRMIRQKPAPYPDRPKGMKDKRKRRIRQP